MASSPDLPETVGASSAEGRVSVVQGQLNQAFLELDLMLRYVLSRGDLDDQASKAVIGVQQLVLASAKVTSPNPPEPEFAESLMTAHAALAKLISPATPLSLAATEPGHRFGYLSNPPLIRWMIWIALISVIGFLVTSIVLGS